MLGMKRWRHPREEDSRMRSLIYRTWQLLMGRGDQFAFLSTLREAERLSGEELERTHEELLGQLLHHAYAQVPYYKRVLDRLGGESLFQDFSPSAILRQMPILTKTIMRNQMQELVSKDLETRKWHFNASGGSTGEPVRLIQDKTYQLWSGAVKCLYDGWTDYQPGMSKVILWGSERDLVVGKETIKTHVGRWLRNERWLNAFRMTEGDMRKYVQIINESRPAQILAYVEAVYELCRFIEEEGLSVHSPSAIMTSAGTLYPQMRATIEKVFRTRVFNRYGSREVGDIACECEQHGGLHISPLTHYVEILSDDGRLAAPGQTGEVIVTSLRNYAMPIIRYQIGDMAVWAEKPCSCGRAWPLLKQVAGRVMDVLVRPDGTRVVPEYFIHIIGVVLEFPWLRKFQVLQEDYNFVRLLVVPSVDFEEASKHIKRERAELEAKVRLVMGNECRLQIEMVDAIPASTSGKYRYVVSKVTEKERR